MTALVFIHGAPASGKLTVGKALLRILPGRLFDNQLATCHPERLLPILALTGTADPSQPYEGRLYPDLGIRTASMPETMQFWRILPGCSGQ